MVKIRFWKSAKYLLPLENLKLIRPNLPNNCLTLDLTQLPGVEASSMKAIKFYFKGGYNDVLISMEDRLNFVKRAQTFHKFGQIGPELHLKTDQNLYQYYAVKFHQNIFVEADPAKKCSNYPNIQYESYAECDNNFVLKFLQNNFPAKFLPIWAIDESENVTKHMNLGEPSNFEDQSLINGSTVELDIIIRLIVLIYKFIMVVFIRVVILIFF